MTRCSLGWVGHLGLTKGTWPILGRLEDWDRSEWSMPVFVRYEELTGRSFRVFYNDDDPNKLIREEQAAPGEGEQGSKDGSMGAGFAEKVLTSLLGGRAVDRVVRRLRPGQPRGAQFDKH